LNKTIDIKPGTTISGMPAPRNWHIIETRADGYAWERLVGEPITVIETIAPKSDGRKWLHVSVAKPGAKKMPTYEDLQVARKLFVGEDKECYQIFPPQERYVNLHNVWHLFACLDAPKGVLPQMDGVIEGKRTI